MDSVVYMYTFLCMVGFNFSTGKEPFPSANKYIVLSGPILFNLVVNYQ